MKDIHEAMSETLRVMPHRKGCRLVGRCICSSRDIVATLVEAVYDDAKLTLVTKDDQNRLTPRLTARCGAVISEWDAEAPE